jgi:hypothetical protein
MTVLTLRRIWGHFVVTAPDIEPLKFKTRREARDWCSEQHPGSPIREVGADAVRKGTAKAKPRDSEHCASNHLPMCRNYAITPALKANGRSLDTEWPRLSGAFSF